jgi:hypothetical protein
MHHSDTLTLYSKVISISEVLLGQPRPLLGDLTHLLGTIRRQNLQCRHTYTCKITHQMEISLNRFFGMIKHKYTGYETKNIIIVQYLSCSIKSCIRHRYITIDIP